MFNREYIFKRLIFHCHVSLPEGTRFQKKCEKVEEVHRIQSMQSRSPLTEDEKSPMFFHTVEILRYFLMWFVFFWWVGRISF